MEHKQKVQIQQILEAGDDVHNAVIANPCLLCNGPPHIASVFIPCAEDLEEMGIPVDPNHGLSVGFTLCRVCLANPDRNTLVQDAVRAMAAMLRDSYMRHPRDPNNN